MKNMFTICILLILIQVSIYPQSFTYKFSNATFLGRAPSGRCLANNSVGSYTYIGDGGIFRVLDTSVPSNPTKLDSIITPGIIQKIIIVGNVAYVADGIGGLRIIDVSTPSNISELGSYSASESNTYSVAVSGNYAFLADGNGGFKVIDISSSSSPTLKAQIPFGNVYDIAVNDTVAYLAASGDGLQTVDIFDPLNPSSLGGKNRGRKAWGVGVSGSYAFIADGDSSLKAFDVTRPKFSNLY